LFSITILLSYIGLQLFTASKLEAQYLMASQIRSHVQYWIPADNTLTFFYRSRRSYQRWPEPSTVLIAATHEGKARLNIQPCLYM